MKSKYGFWKRWLNSLTGLAGLAGLVCLTGCKELTCDYTYSPTTPAAGGVVTFSNSSTGADDYYWNFGDNGTSTSASPTHIFRKPGTYTVTLQIMRNKVEKRTRTQHITVIDTIPTIACDSDTVYSFTPTKFYAQIYNPWKKTITYEWSVPEDAVVLAGQSLDSSAVVCYCTQVGKASQLQLTIQQGDQAKQTLTYAFTPEHKKGLSVIYIDENQAFEQFTYTIQKQHVFQSPEPTTLQANLDSLKKEQDTLYVYGQNVYTLAIVGSLLQEDIKGFQVDRLMNKIYAYSDAGLWVSNMAGVYKRQLLSNSIQAIDIARDECEEKGLTPDNGKIFISVRNSSTSEDCFDIVFEDNGPGVSKENMEKLFTPNFTTKNSGTGLGLAICKNILEKCSARISYSRSFTLDGACFTIVYPKYSEKDLTSDGYKAE